MHTLLLALLLTAPTSGEVDERLPNPPNLLLADLGLHVVGVGYQRTLADHLAAQVDLESYTPWTQNSDFLGLSGTAYKSDVTGVAVRGRVFIYPLGAAPTGFWISPFAQGGVGWGTRADQRLTGSIWAVGASAGYAWLLFRTLHLVIGVGGQYHAADFPGGSDAPSFGRFYPTLDASVGYAF